MKTKTIRNIAIKHLVMILFLLTGLSSSFSMDIRVEFMDQSLLDMSGAINKRLDNNGNACALIKIHLPMTGVSFEGSIIGDISFKGGEYWVYVTPGTKYLQIKHPYIHPYMMRFKDWINNPIIGSTTYVVTVSVLNDQFNLSMSGRNSIVYDGNNPDLKKAINILEDNSESDKSVAVNILRALSDNKNISAMVKLAECLEAGIGVEQDYDEAADIYKELIKNGDNTSKIRLAEFYLQGFGVTKNEAKGMRYMQEAADNGSSEAAYKFGQLLQNVNATENNDTLAFNYFSLSAKNGFSEAFYKLGQCYEYGLGTDIDFRKALTTYQKGVEAGSHGAMNRLGQIYSKGMKYSWLEPLENGYFMLQEDSIPKDLKKSAEYFNLAIENGSLYAMNNLAVLYSENKEFNKDKSEIFKLYITSAEKGNPFAQLNLGVNLFAGTEIEKDVYEAGKWLYRAANQGVSEAQLICGRMLLGGIGTVPDINKAITWYKAAADNEDPSGEFMTGIFYDIGLGVEQDFTKAIKYYSKAAGHMFNYSKYARSVLDEYKNETEIWNARKSRFLAYNTLIMAAEEGDVLANWLLGHIYSNGISVDRNDSQAAEYYDKAATLGDVRSKYELALLYSYGDGFSEKPDERKILELIMDAANDGYAIAEFAMGLYHQNGLYGLEENEDIATEWYEKASLHGYNPVDLSYDEE